MVTILFLTTDFDILKNIETRQTWVIKLRVDNFVEILARFIYN
jgi:hypothetical protein